MDEMAILPQFTGTTYHDHWSPYFSYDNAKHALCNAHHLRELTFLEKQYNQTFAPKMANLLIEINQAKQACQADHFEPNEIEDYETCAELVEVNAMPKLYKKSFKPTQKSSPTPTRKTNEVEPNKHLLTIC